AARDEQLQRLGAVRRRRAHERRGLVVAGRVDVGVRGNQQLRDRRVPFGRRDHQRRHPGVVGGVDVGAAGDRLLDEGGLAVEHGVGERRRLRRRREEQDRGERETHGGGRTIAYGTLSRLQICG